MTDTQTPLFAPTHSKHHWPEDFEHENGNYFCKCNTCDADFVGHKRRVQCKSCFVTAVVAERDQLKAELERLGNAKAGNDKNNLYNIEYWQRKCLAAEAKLTELEKHRA